MYLLVLPGSEELEAAAQKSLSSCASQLLSSAAAEVLKRTHQLEAERSVTRICLK